MATKAPASSSSEMSSSTRYEPPRGPAKSRETRSSCNSIMDRVVHEPQSGLRDGVGGGAFAMRTVAAVLENPECTRDVRRRVRGRQRGAQRLQLSGFGARISRTMNEQCRNIQPAEAAIVEIIERRLCIAADSQPCPRMQIDNLSPPFTVIVRQDGRGTRPNRRRVGGDRFEKCLRAGLAFIQMCGFDDDAGDAARIGQTEEQGDNRTIAMTPQDRLDEIERIDDRPGLLGRAM